MSNIGPTINKDGLEFYFNFESLQCFAERSVPVYNHFTKESDFTGNGSDFGMEDWTSSTLITSHDPSIITPIGSGATAFVGSETYGYQYFRRFKTLDRGKSSFSFYIYPIANLDYVAFGLGGDYNRNTHIRFDSGQVTYSSLILRNEQKAGFEQVDGYPGWYRVWGRIINRPGGFVPTMSINSYGNGVSFPSGSIPSGYITGMMQTASPEPNIPYVFGARDLFEPQIGPTCKIARSSSTISIYQRASLDNLATEGDPEFEYALRAYTDRWIEPQSQPFTPGADDFTISFKISTNNDGHMFNGVTLFHSIIYSSDDLDIRISSGTANPTQFTAILDGGSQFSVTLDSGVFDSEGVYYIDMVFDRDGDLEIFIDGQSEGDVDISSKSSYSIDPTNTQIFRDVFLNIHYFGYYNKKLTTQQIINNYKSLVTQE